MRSLGTRRVAPAAGAVMVAVIALAGCSAGQVAETAILKAPVSGLDTQSPDGGLLIRNLQVIYNNPDGYQANDSAPLQVSLFNQTEQAITVTITSKPQQDVTVGIVSAQQVGLSGGPAAEPSGVPAEPAESPSADTSAEPTQAPLPPAKITIEPLGSATFLPEDDDQLVASGLTGPLRPGYSLSLSFQVDNGPAIDVMAPFAIPTSPASRGPGIEGENSEE